MLQLEDCKFYEDKRGLTRGPTVWAPGMDPDRPWVIVDAHGETRFTLFGQTEKGQVPRAGDLIREVPASQVVADKQVWANTHGCYITKADKPVALDETRLQQTIQNGTDLWAGQVGGNHYTKHRIQPLEFMMANRLDGTESLVLKYICRWRDKGGIEDLHKARDVLAKMIDYAERNPEYVKP